MSSVVRFVAFPITAMSAIPRDSGDFLKPPHHSAGKPEAVLVISYSTGEARSQSVNRVEIRAHKIDLRCANSKVVCQSNIQSAAKSHGKRVAAIKRG